MKKLIITLCLLATVCGGSKAQETKDSIDTSRFVVTYDYECRTQNDEEQDVTDRMQVTGGKVGDKVDAVLCLSHEKRVGRG